MGEAVRLLEAGLDKALTDEGFREYLDLQAKFHSYSWSNVLLIMSQRPDATYVAGFRKWKELGRHVLKGEQGIRIFFPMFSTTEWEDPNTGDKTLERRLTGYGMGSVFDVSQTDGKELALKPPIVENTDRTDASEALNLKLSRWGLNEGLRMESKPIFGHAKGYYRGYVDPKEICIRRDVAIDEDGTESYIVEPLSVSKTKTLAHELSHYVAGHSPLETRNHAEMVAEGSAYVVMHHFGIDTGEYSFPYMAGWGADREKLKAGLGEIQRVSSTIIKGVGEIQHPLDEGDLEPQL